MYKNKNCSQLDRKLSKRGFVNTKIVVNGSKLNKIILRSVNTRNMYKNKNQTKLDRKLSKRGFVNTKIVVNDSKLNKIILR